MPETACFAWLKGALQMDIAADTHKRRVLLTGSAGRIGTAYRAHAGENYAFTLADIRPTPNPGHHPSVTADLADLDTVRKLCEGIDTVVHMAADPRTYADFYDDLLGPNFRATYNIFRAAKDAGCRRVIFASSVNAVFGYPGSRQVRTTDAPMPGNVYGASKAFGESLGAYFGLVEGLSTLCIRIGGVGELTNIVGDTPVDIRSIFVTMRDLCHLLDRCIETPDIDFMIVHGVSNNEHSFLDLTDTRARLGYNPVDDAYHPEGGVR